MKDDLLQTSVSPGGKPRAGSRMPGARRRVALAVLVTTGCVFSLAGCGQKGPLYLPASAHAPASAAGESAPPSSPR